MPRLNTPSMCLSRTLGPIISRPVSLKVRCSLARFKLQSWSLYLLSSFSASSSKVKGSGVTPKPSTSKGRRRRSRSPPTDRSVKPKKRLGPASPDGDDRSWSPPSSKSRPLRNAKRSRQYHESPESGSDRGSDSRSNSGTISGTDADSEPADASPRGRKRRH